LILKEAERRFNKKPGARNDLYDSPVMGWEAYLQSKGVKPGTFRQWEFRTRLKQLQALVGPSTVGSNSKRAASPRVDRDAVVDDVASALANLGYRKTDAKQAVDQALAADGTLANRFDDLLRRTLAGLKGISCEDDGKDSHDDAAQNIRNTDPLLLAVLPTEELMCCGGCRDMHAGIAQLAWANPKWDDDQLVEASGCNLLTVRQARTRFLAWRKVGA
jgi:hypothetical protein